MQRLEWKLDPDGSINAQHDGWAFEIIFQPEQGMWQLCIEPTPDRGPDWRNWHLTAYLQDAMAIAQAIAAGATIG